MPATFNKNGLPECCGIILLPTLTEASCPVCLSRYDTQEIADEMRRLIDERRITSRCALEEFQVELQSQMALKQAKKN